MSKALAPLSTHLLMATHDDEWFKKYVAENLQSIDLEERDGDGKYNKSK